MRGENRGETLSFLSRPADGIGEVGCAAFEGEDLITDRLLGLLDRGTDEEEKTEDQQGEARRDERHACPFLAEP
ncbi:MAG: hypothetical protein P4L85_00940 [Paludisphaera borealis]|uniref:hypothetical protein n=1 Tax=Paludisphaera borealis TaxID=1387353 RepID=UPI0028422876|nr:hypothetical protein [Paludisphaera borealis]MDR3617886.1 hypothetical protein [Paludisphaera borealis]